MKMYTTDKLKLLRKKHNYTVYEMAYRLNITPSYYSQIENQKRRLYYDMAIKIAEIFHKKPDQIFYEYK